MRLKTKLKLKRARSLRQAIKEQAYDLAHNDSIHQHRDNQRNRRLRA